MGVNENKLNQLWDFCEGDTSQVLHRNVAANEHEVAISAGYPLWMKTSILEQNSSPANPQIAGMDWVLFSTASAYNDSDIAYEGAGWGSSIVPPVTGVTCNRNDTRGAYAEWTTESSSAVIAHIGRQSNGGLAIVSIDGDTTAANMCRTAKEYVDAGWYPNTILTANGGICGETDRVINCSRYMEGSSNMPIDEEALLLATGLSNTTHILRLTVVGVTDLLGSGGSRLYVSGMSTLDLNPSLNTNEYTFKSGLVNLSVAPANLATSVEHTMLFSITDGGATDRSGGVHGYENLISINASITDNTVQIIRETTLNHALNPSTVYADVTTVYTFSRDGLQLDTRYEIKANVWVDSLYLAMKPMLKYQGIQENRPDMDRIVASNYAGFAITTRDDDTITDLALSNVVAHYESAASLIACTKFNSVDLVLSKVFLDDKSANYGQSKLKNDKVYFDSISASQTPYVAGDVLSATITHRFGVSTESNVQSLIDGFSGGNTFKIIDSLSDDTAFAAIFD